MDKAIFQFNSFHYDHITVATMPRETCEHLSNHDEENVIKFNVEGEGSLETLLNNDMLDVDNSFYRVFLDE